MKRTLPVCYVWSLALFSLLGWSNSTIAEDETDRKIAASDTIMIEVFREKDLTLECRVQAGGTITYPLLGNVAVAGKTTAEVVDTLKEKLGEYLVDPQVTVNVKEYRQRTVLVMGCVMKPGTIKLLPEQKMTILDAIGEAGGFTREANKRKIEHTRKGKKSTYKLEDLLNETSQKKTIWLEPGDVINVKESFL